MPFIEDKDYSCLLYYNYSYLSIYNLFNFSNYKAEFDNTFFLFFLVKYLGLLAMSKILKTHPKSVQAHKDLVLQCLDDKDESIRLRALDLLYGMVSNFIFNVSK